MTILSFILKTASDVKSKSLYEPLMKMQWERIRCFCHAQVGYFRDVCENKIFCGQSLYFPYHFQTDFQNLLLVQPVFYRKPSFSGLY